GVLYAGLMLTHEGPKVVEFNCRFGDPEVQCVLPLLENDIMDIFQAIIEDRLEEIKLRWHQGSSACVVMASGGYPGAYEKDKVISGLNRIGDDIAVFHAGT